MPSEKQTRYKQRRIDGFSPSGSGLPSEANMLSRFDPDNIPYIDRMITDRKRRVGIALKRGWTKDQWFNGLRAWYKRMGWTKKSLITGKLLYDPYIMLRWYREQFKKDNPDYKGMWRKRQSDIKALERKIKRSKEVAY